MTVLILLAAVAAFKIWRPHPRRPSPSLAPLPFARRRKLFGTLTLAEVSFDYERAVIELDNVSDETKDRAISALSRVILPLVGHVRLDDVTPQLQKGMGLVLREQLNDDNHWVVHVWEDLLRWGRFRFAAESGGQRPRSH